MNGGHTKGARQLVVAITPSGNISLAATVLRKGRELAPGILVSRARLFCAWKSPIYKGV